MAGFRRDGHICCELFRQKFILYGSESLETNWLYHGHKLFT